VFYHQNWNELLDSRFVAEEDDLGRNDLISACSMPQVSGRSQPSVNF
jgi:hypothetical protein